MQSKTQGNMHVAGTQNIADLLARLIYLTIKSRTTRAQTRSQTVCSICGSQCDAESNEHSIVIEVEEAPATDDKLHNVRRAIKAGCFDECKPCVPIVGEQCVIGQLVLLSTLAILPAKFRSRAVALAPEGHLGLISTKQKLRI